MKRRAESARGRSGASRRDRSVQGSLRHIVVWAQEERGSVTVMVALAAMALTSFLALGIDLGALFNARSEAQRAADAASLAGASAFLEVENSKARKLASDRAVEFATSNEIRNEPIEAGEVTVWIDVDSATVRTEVRRDAVPTWFAKLFGIDSVDVAAQATAWAGAAGAASCVKPFAVPDLWEERSDDVNGNRIWDEGERWKYDPGAGDRYAGFSGTGGSTAETGYGSSWRDGQVGADGMSFDGDYGRRITLKVTNPRDAFVPSFFYPWVLPRDPNQQACGGSPGGGGGNGGGNGGGKGGGKGGGNGGGNGGGDTGGGPDGDEPSDGDPFGWLKWWEKREDLGNSGDQDRPWDGGNGGGGSGGGGRGAAAYRQNICSCNNSVIDLDTEYDIEPGNMVGPTYQGVSSLIALDPDAYWDDRTNSVVSQYGMNSPRVVTVALFDPGEITKPGRQKIRFNNFARVFIEEQASRRDPVTGRFLYYVPGVGRGGPGSTTGSLVRTLQLIR